MKKNIGQTDKWIRIAFAAIVIILYFTHIISGTLAIILGVFAITFLLTSFINFCPIYTLFGINTIKKEK